MDNDKCSNCRYWKESKVRRTNSLKKYGECLEGPPSSMVNGYGVWPLTGEDDWCGKYRPVDSVLRG